MTVRDTRPEEFEDRFIFMSISNDIAWTKKGNSLDCISNSKEVRDYSKRFQLGHWSFLGLGEEENCADRTHTNLKHNGILLLRSWYPISNMADIQSSEHPVRWIEDF